MWWISRVVFPWMREGKRRCTSLILLGAIAWCRRRSLGMGWEAAAAAARERWGALTFDWKETARAHVLKVDVPGFRREEVRVEVVGGRVLQISGERSNEEEEEGGVWHYEERSGGKFLRRLRLPENAKVDEVKATVKNGVLTVTVAKEEVGLKSEVKVVDISD
ncbi:18.1 kDa class I heat shock protein-like [Salvia miltiorrhiza]|uniref:18.1 kDa class I heat shock protein-like n=1 Tax=Salvia miltiorrhiza TaxID=226208 RepID=UPI0025AD9ADA|nr:18.1 kDa class I heat shock protein-like [Salvia miltiorrhiza]